VISGQGIIIGYDEEGDKQAALCPGARLSHSQASPWERGAIAAGQMRD